VLSVGERVVLEVVGNEERYFSRMEGESFTGACGGFASPERISGMAED